jgi:hypothetical protein
LVVAERRDAEVTGDDITQSSQDLADLRRAVGLLESPSLTIRMTNLLGSPIEAAVKHLPAFASKKIHGAVEVALFKAAEAALWSMDNSPGKAASTRRHKFAVAATGALGGAFGLPALMLELPVSTTLMMRAVADVARSEHFDLDDFATRQACLEVFALGGRTNRDDAGETGYYAVRGFTADAMRHLSKELAQIAAKQGGGLSPSVTSKQAAKWLAALIEKVATRFGIVVTEKFAAQAVPVVGAVTGAALNALFTDYYQDMARGHFIVRRLEAKYGDVRVEAVYRALKAGQSVPALAPPG